MRSKIHLFVLLVAVLLPLLCLGTPQHISPHTPSRMLLATADDSNATPSPQPAFSVHEFNLSNGLKLLVKEDHRAPVVISQIWYRVGSADEYSGITGISHFLEHLMFKGTNKYPRAAFTETIKRYGGRDNAFTSRDYTAYYQLFEKSYLEKSFDLESDRMINLQLRQADFDKEREVVREERRWRVDDQPESMLYEQLYASAFNVSPYRQPIIGWDDDLVNMKLSDLSDWYQNWYAPNNATLVVVGDVAAAEVHALAKQYFGALKARPLAERRTRHEPPQRGEKRIQLAVPATQPLIAIAYRVPRAGRAEVEWHPYALAVLAAVMAGSDSARFAKNLVRGQGIAFYANAYYSVYNRYQNLFAIITAPNTQSTTEQLTAAIEEELAQLKESLVADAELEKIKTQLLAQRVYQQDSLQSQASALGRLETIGVGWQAHFRFPERINAVTAEQVREVARRYLIEDQRTVAELKPLPMPSSQAASQ